MQFQPSRVLACALLGAPVLAANGAEEGNQTWLGLDQEISNLTNSLSTQSSSANVGGVIRSSWQSIDADTGLTAGGTEDIEAFVLLDADIWVEGAEGDYSWRFNADLDGGPAGSLFGQPTPGLFQQIYGADGFLGGSAILEDAYVSWSANDEISIVWGNFKAPTSLSNHVDPENLVLIQRTIAGQSFEDWQLGAMIQGNFDQFAGFLAVQNGADGFVDDYRITARGEFRINGGVGGGSGRLGAHGATTDELAATVGVTLRDDEGASFTGGPDTTIFVIDGALTASQFGAHAEYLALDDDIGDGNIFALTGSFAISESLEAALRYEKVDDLNGLPIGGIANNFELDRITAGIAYIQEGARWAINISDVEADDSIGALGDDSGGLIVEVGLTVGKSRG